VPRDGDSQGDELWAARYVFPAIEGLAVLQLQADLYTFLVQICKAIIAHISENLTAQVSPKAAAKATTNSYDPFELEMGVNSSIRRQLEANYKLPGLPDLDHLKDMVSARCSAAEVHIWALREDPSYFETNVRGFRDHQRDLLSCKGLSGTTQNNYSNATPMWESALNQMLYTSAAIYEYWTWVSKLVSRLQEVYDTHDLSFTSGLPCKEYVLAFLVLHDALELGTRHFLKVATTLFQCSPNSRPFHYVDLEKREYGFINIIREVIRYDPFTTHINHIEVDRILAEIDRRIVSGLPSQFVFVEWMQRAIDKDTKRKYFSDLSIDWIAEVLVMLRCLQPLEYHSPWIKVFQIRAKKPGMRRQVENFTSPWTATLSAYARIDIGDDVAEYGTPHGTPYRGNFEYSIDHRRTAHTVKVLRNAESNLDMFWKEADQYMKTSQIMSPRLRNLIARRTPVRTPEWVDPPRASKSVHTQRKSHHVEPLPADYYAELACRTQATTANNVTAAPKAKKKTRGQPDPTLAAPAAEEEANNIALQPRKSITVSPRVLLVFRAILDHS
jgi:hypothetical protein